MKKLTALTLATALTLSLTACGGGTQTAQTPQPTASAETRQSSAPAQEQVELVVFAAASLTETLTQIAGDYKTVAPNVTLTFNFDSSGTLKTQIQEGAVCDVFLSAAPKQMDQLDIEADPAVNTEGLDFVLQGSRVDLLENKVALAVPEGNPAGIQSYDDLAKRLEEGDVLLAIGNSDVPVGQYTQKIFAYYGLEEDALNAAGVLTYGSNVKEVTSQISEGAVDCGIVYATDVFSAGLAVADTATGDMCGRVVYPAAVLNTSAHSEEAQAFLDYLAGDAAGAVFSCVGFSPLS